MKLIYCSETPLPWDGDVIHEVQISPVGRDDLT